MKKSDLVHEWITLAEQDKLAAEYLTSMKPVPLEIICFHCQQAAEKAFKALYQVADIEIIKTHDLMVLLNTITAIQPELSNLETECNILNDYSVTVRYPKQFDISEADMHSAVKAANTILHFVKKSPIISDILEEATK